MQQPPRPAMPGLSRPVADHGAGDHLVGFYTDEPDLARAVTAFLRPALDAGDAAVIVATPRHRHEFLAELTADGVAVEAARASGRLVVLDADELLQRFLRDGRTDPVAFEEVVGAVLAGASGGGRQVRVFGEMVSLLWEQGNVTAVVELEDAWNDLAERHPFALFCAYPLHGFDDASPSRTFRDVVARHSHVLPFGVPAAEVAALRNEFVSMVVHDIQSPTTVVSALLGLLRSGWRDMPAETLDDHLDAALRSVRRIERLTADIMTVARIDAGAFTYDLRAVDIGGIIERAVGDVVGATDRRIECTVPDGLPDVMADPDRQSQILTNLLTNAVKFSREGALVTVSVSRGGDHLAVHVRDEGIGIGEDEQAGLFLPFSRLRRGRQVRGTGLGLHTAKALVEGQGGRIWVDSVAGKGSTFSYTVPLA